MLSLVRSSALLTAALFAVPAVAEPSSTEAGKPSPQFSARSAAIDTLFKAEAAKGGSFIVRYDLDGNSFVKAYGHLDCARTRPMTDDALIDSGSITKAFTYAAVFKLVEEGRLKLDDRLGQLFPNVPRDKAGITVSQLMESRSGFHDFVRPDGTIPTGDTKVIVNDYLPLTKQQLLTSAFASPLRYAPGTKSEYSNLAYQLLAAIIEAKSGMSYEHYVREKLLLPSGMKDTGYVLPDFRGKVIAEQCEGAQAWGDPVTRGAWKNGVSWNLLGAGGMMTTVHDLKRWTDAAVSGKLFRPDIQQRFRRGDFFMGTDNPCGTELSAVAGSNALTFAAYFHKPRKKEVFVMASTRSDHLAPDRQMLPILCAPPSAAK